MWPFRNRLKDAPASQPKKNVSDKTAAITVEEFKKKIEEALNKLDDDFSRIRINEEFKSLDAKYNNAYKSWCAQEGGKNMGNALIDIVFFYNSRITGPALKQINDLMTQGSKYCLADDQSKYTTRSSLIEMLMLINKDILLYNKIMDKLFEQRSNINKFEYNKKYYALYKRIWKENFKDRAELERISEEEEHDFQQDILGNLRAVIKVQAREKKICYPEVGKKAGGAARRSPTPPEAGVSDDRVMNLDTFQAELEAKQALINEEFRVVQEENAKIANRLILMQPLNVNAVSNQSVAEELAAFEAESDPPSPSQDSRAAELAAQQQSAAVRAARITSASPNPPGAGSAAAGGDAVRAAVRNSARASSPGSESSRTESAADSLLAEQADEIEARAAGRSPARASSPGGALPQKKEEQSTKGLRTIIAQDPSGLTMPFRPISPVQQRAGDSPRKKINERSKGGLSVLATPQPKTMGVPEPSYAIEAGAAGRSPARASSPGGSRNAIEARATTPPQRTNSLGGALPQPGAGGGGGPLSNPPGAGGDSPAMRRQTRYEVIESINEKQIYFLINIAKGLQGKNKEEVTTLLTEIANKKPELYQQVLRDDDELGPAYSKHFIDEFYKDENSQSTQFIEALIADNNELRVIKTIFSTIKTRQQPIVHRDGPDQGASDEQGRAWTNCIFGGGARSNPTKATSTLEGDDISIASSTSSGAEHNPGRV